jgi:glycosyltransferase involved in cell wall biosynthesis
MHVGIVSPCSSGPLADLLADSNGLDLGCGVHFMATLVRALIGRGHRVSVVTLSSEISAPKIFKGPELTYYVYPERTQRRMRDLYKVERQGLRDGIRLAKPDVLHAHWTYEFALACFDAGLPTLVTIHDNAFRVLRFTRDLYRLGRLYLQIQVIRQARLLTSVSPYLADSLGWLAKTEIKVIPNPVEVSLKQRYCRQPTSRAVRIATVLNGWQKLKNPQSAIRAFQLLRRQLPDAQMFMYGHDFQDGGPAWHWAAIKGLSENIEFCGFVLPDELRKRLSTMSLLLHPALEEACPMAILESMAIGLPVVAGINVGGVPWVLDEGRAGYLTDMRDPQKIFETLLICIEEKQMRHEKQRQAFVRVTNSFSPDLVAAQYEKMYAKTLSLDRTGENSMSDLAEYSAFRTEPR